MILLLAVLGPLCWGVAGLIDRGVEAVLAWHSRRDPADGRRISGPPRRRDPAGPRSPRRDGRSPPNPATRGRRFRRTRTAPARSGSARSERGPTRPGSPCHAGRGWPARPVAAQPDVADRPGAAPPDHDDERPDVGAPVTPPAARGVPAVDDVALVALVIVA